MNLREQSDLGPYCLLLKCISRLREQTKRVLTGGEPLKQKLSIQAFFDISVNTGQICMGFEADTPKKWQQQAHCMRLSDKNLVKKLLTSNQIFGCSSITF